MWRLLIIVAAGALVAAACGDDDSSTIETDDVSTSSIASSPETVPEPSADDAADAGEAGGARSATGIAATVADGWSLTEISPGIKPVLALDPAGEPAVAFLDERLSEGYVSYASRAEGWAVDAFIEGYFYGPIGLDFDPSGFPNIVYHDHQASFFDGNLGDLTHAVRTDAGWVVTAAGDDGHDGWDSVIAVADDGVVRAAGIDPAQFGSSDGVEYYELVDGTWNVTSISDGVPIEYEFNVDLQVGSDGSPALTYFLTGAGDLVYAHRDGDGTWTRDVVDEGGDVGRYSSLAFAPDGSAHIAYWDATNSQIKHATNSSGAWVSTVVGTLDAVEPGQEGARRIAAVAVESTGTPVVAFSDTSGMWYGRAPADQWDVDQIVTAGSRPLGQLVSMRLDQSDVAHIAFFEVAGNRPLSGLIAYLSQG